MKTRTCSCCSGTGEVWERDYHSEWRTFCPICTGTGILLEKEKVDPFCGRCHLPACDRCPRKAARKLKAFAYGISNHNPINEGCGITKIEDLC